MNESNKQITKEEMEQFLFQANEWWNSLGGTQKLFRLLAYKKAYGKDIDYPNADQIMLLYALEIKTNQP